MELGRLEKIDLRSHWRREATDFTPWLAEEENLKLLSETIGIALELQSREERVGPFSADILCKDMETDHYVLIENQLERTDHLHLGQLITYAAGLEAVTIIWIAQRFTEEHRAALDWLNNSTNENLEFFGIEIELYKIGNSVPAPKFNIVAKPNNWSKIVRRNAENAEISNTQLLQLEYWTALKEYVDQHHFKWKMQKPGAHHWASVAIGRSGFHIDMFVNARGKRLGVALMLMNPGAELKYKKLEELYKEDSLVHLDPNLIWEFRNTGKQQTVKLRCDDVEFQNKNKWSEYHAFFAKAVDKFYHYFQDKIKNLDYDRS